MKTMYFRKKHRDDGGREGWSEEGREGGWLRVVGCVGEFRNRDCSG